MVLEQQIGHPHQLVLVSGNRDGVYIYTWGCRIIGMQNLNTAGSTKVVEPTHGGEEWRNVQYL